MRGLPGDFKSRISNFKRDAGCGMRDPGCGLRAVISYLEFQISNGLRVISNLGTFRNFTLAGEGLPTRL